MSCDIDDIVYNACLFHLAVFIFVTFFFYLDIFVVGSLQIRHVCVLNFWLTQEKKFLDFDSDMEGSGTKILITLLKPDMAYWQ
jgi:hypothetical protein